MHAMASIGDRSAKDTYDRIMAWARFAFQVGRGKQRLTDNYCATMDRQPEALRNALQMQDRSYCTRRSGLFRTYEPWTVRTFFTLTCRNVISSRNCSEPLPGPEGDELARTAATGALLHLVQDSFSQAHAARWVTDPVTVRGPFTPRVVCTYPTSYFDYGQQTKELHGPSDKPPVRDASCDDDARTQARDDPQTDDVVTASAMILWFLDQREDREEAFMRYLAERVFGPTPA